MCKPSQKTSHSLSSPLFSSSPMLSPPLPSRQRGYGYSRCFQRARGKNGSQPGHCRQNRCNFRVERDWRVMIQSKIASPLAFVVGFFERPAGSHSFAPGLFPCLLIIDPSIGRVAWIEPRLAVHRGVYTMDLKNGNGSIRKGDSGGTADCTVTVSEQVSPSLSFPHGPTDAPLLPLENVGILIGTGMPCCRILSTWCGARRTVRSCS